MDSISCTSPNLCLLFTLISILISVDCRYPAVFNFGDSNSDTGNLVAGTGQTLNLPNGQTHFNRSSGRFCDGRLIVDFLMDAMELPFLNAYLDSIGAPVFRRGCNFAAAGATVLKPPARSLCPFSLRIQVAQFLRFKAKVEEIQTESSKYEEYIPAQDYFEKALYMFDIAQNDLNTPFMDDKTVDEVVASIPTILLEFENGIEKVYDQGGRNFWIHNTGPLGCLPMNIAGFGNEEPFKLDELGCVGDLNRVARIFNLNLLDLTKKLQGQYPDANITLVDIFSIKLDLIANYSLHGFKQPRMACCGYGGPPFNYDRRVSCGETAVVDGSLVMAGGCDDSREYVSWDGVHYTEAANRHVASQILTGKYYLDLDHPPVYNMCAFS
ncbi:GDSL esterase/lipase [Striga hermonthica]|uniref:GDSL esterase/lipase n=1 Tax=Striga hermonthica TaxID=68872 RepID=A0A9N7NFZ1_STRHE|nr:GDSL esterase/lipase [Striga hermonthica]